MINQPRSSQRYQCRHRDDEAPLVRCMLELARSHPRHEHRLIAGAPRRDGWAMNRKRVYRLWRREGLNVPQERPRRRCRAERPNDVSAWDFVFDHTSSGRQLKLLSIAEEFTRECRCLSASRRFTSFNVKDELASLIAVRGLPWQTRSDNGPEFIAQALRDWLTQLQMETLYIEPGAPWENGYAESFHSRFRDAFLSMEIFDRVSATRRLTTLWKDGYSHRRPNSSLGYRTPVAPATYWTASTPVAALPPFQQPNP